MSLVAIAFFAVAVALATFGGSATRTSAITNCTVDSGIDSEEQQMLTLINQHRQANGVPPLQFSDTLNRAAAWKSKHMADLNYFAHDDVPINRTWVQRLRDCGYTYNTYLGENIAAGNAGASATFQQWLNSPGHNANMLDANYRAIGIGRAYNADSTYRWYWTTDFGGVADGFTPAPPAPTPTNTPLPTATPTPTSTPLPPPPPPSGNDADGDGCDDALEQSVDPARGGMRNPNNRWDFFDTPDVANGRDRIVSVGDVSRTIGRFGQSGDPNVDPLSPPPATGYHTAFDRSAPLPGGDPWDLEAPDGAIGAGDILFAVNQFGHSCA